MTNAEGKRTISEQRLPYDLVDLLTRPLEPDQERKLASGKGHFVATLSRPGLTITLAFGEKTLRTVHELIEEGLADQELTQDQRASYTFALSQLAHVADLH